jgi:iron(III) transport system ATP-binding protein
MSGATPALAVRDLVVRYGATVAVRSACLDVPSGGVTALLGASGCGKTSLLRAVAGLGEVASGTITIAGEVVTGPGVWLPPERRRVGMVFQEGALFPHLTVSENVRYGLHGTVDAAEREAAALALVGMEEHAGRFPDQLSGGQQQRVALARALAPRPRLVLLDEPFASLDATLRGRVREEVRQILRRAGATAVLVTHDQEEALSIADTVAVMEDGVVVQVGTPEEVYHRPATARVARFVGDGQLLPAVVERGQAATAFGVVPVAGGDGSGLLLVRPEDLELLPAETSEGRSGVIERRLFFGHDQVDEVVCADPALPRLQVRSLASRHPPVGAAVRLRLRPKSYAFYGDGQLP